MKKIITLIIVVLLSIYFIACGKVRNAPSQLKILNIGIVDGKGNNGERDVAWSTGIDAFQGVCIDPDDLADCTSEPFSDSYANMIIKNYFKFNVTLTHYYFVIKNYYGNGNDYISPNLGLIGDTFLPGNKDEENNTNANNATQKSVYAIFLPIGSRGRVLPGSNETVENRGTFNIVFHVYGRADNGDEVTAINTTSITITDYDNCNGDEIYSDSCLPVNS